MSYNEQKQSKKITPFDKILTNPIFKEIKCVIGLGNPGIKYEQTRHNIGFIFLDNLAEAFNLQFSHCGPHLIAEHCFFTNEEEASSRKILFCKPMNFMNASSDILSIVTKKGIKTHEIMVIHDELEKPSGYLAYRFGGSASGHNGVRSIISKAGPNFFRLRVGISRPIEEQKVAKYVLSNFSDKELPNINSAIEQFINLFNN
jgi:PTH1 family peptidyl-tRNA hydrolase